MFSFLFAFLAADVSAASPIPARDAAVKPKFIAGPNPGLQPDARALGHHGVVIARATIAIDGSLKNIQIEQSSKSPILDAAALAVLPQWRLSPAKDANGNMIEVTATFPFSFEGDGGNSRVVRYRCDAFTRDMTWWRSVSPDKPDKDHKLYTMLVGVRVIANPKGMMEGLKTAASEGAIDWSNAVQRCASKPNELMIDQLKIGPVIRRLSKPGR